MRRSFWLGLAILGGLAAAAVALAAGALSTKSVWASFTAAPSAQNRTATCKGADGDYTVIRGEYRGMSSSSDPRLAGPITIKGESFVNKTTGLGWMNGAVRIDTTSDEDTKATFAAVISGGTLSGFLTGRVHDPAGRLLSGIQAAFGADGVGNGTIASGSGTPALVVAGGCGHRKHEQRNGKHKH